MHLLQVGGLRMRKQNGGVGDGAVGAEASTDFARGIASSGKVAKKSATTSTSRCHTNKLIIYAVALGGLVFAFSSYSDIYGVSAMPRCAPCPGGECPDPPEGSCVYGVITNFCGRRVCAKGPGEVCGTGMFKMLGTCGDGMYCNCGRCIGCSIFTMECFDKTCTK